MKTVHLLDKQSVGKASNIGLYEAIAMIKTAKEAEIFFQDLCTPAEIEAMVDRWRVVALVKKGKPYRKINTETGISVTTIGRVARCIMLGEGGYNLIFDRLKKKTSTHSPKTRRKRYKG